MAFRTPGSGDLLGCHGLPNPGSSCLLQEKVHKISLFIITKQDGVVLVPLPFLVSLIHNQLLRESMRIWSADSIPIPRKKQEGKLLDVQGSTAKYR